ncbi:Imidazolonepropionase [Alkalithermobacter thermoalcaliphilus JW-YL-7 = DSM 7308]|uniref:Amidohydrolase n=1 Tax=Alkalithermobacter thermoalcaliphilus JW-YL-7 = DSM 7308 TaxID=1121328 RepID=A0A150FN71_CLOPD|nr:amidohydrolase [[Clostridium] paradoxum JW-YL-7 = DSM 7308]SHL06674.1 Imidazolonepropionase [[Clostridium] paradoxum JW-YL-7 = DSM 7308]
MICIKNATIYTITNGIIENGDILIKDGKIAQIGKEIQAPLDSEIIDAKGKYVFPGFIDAHTHLGMWEDSMGYEGADGNEETDPITPHLRAIDAINPMDRNFKEALEGGITTVASGPGSANVIGGQFIAIKTYGDRIDDMIVKDPIGMKIAFGENPKSVYGKHDKSPQTRMATAALLRETLKEAQIYFEKLQLHEKDEENEKPDYNIKNEALIPVLKKEIPLKAHAHRADDIFTAIRIAKEFDLNLTLEHCTEGHLIVDHLVKEGYPAIVGPTLSDRSKIELKNLTFETPGILAKKGMTVCLMTDHPVIPVQYLPLCASLAVKGGMSVEDALKSITINPAKVLGIDDKVGSIEVGKDADIVIWDSFPLEIQSRVLYTIIDGNIVYKYE